MPHEPEALIRDTIALRQGRPDELGEKTLCCLMLEIRNLKLEDILTFLGIIEFPVSNFQFLQAKTCHLAITEVDKF